MKTFLTILSSVLICTIFFVPTEDASLSTYFLWAIWVCGALYIVNTIWKKLDEWDKEDSKE